MATNTQPVEPVIAELGRRRRRRRAVWRLFGWGTAATLAVTAAVLTSQTEAGSKRLQIALAYANDPTSIVALAQIPASPPGAAPNAETQRLAAQLNELTADRARLIVRIASLEHSLDDVTGSIKQQAAATAAHVPAAPLPSAAPAIASIAPPSAQVTPSPAAPDKTADTPPAATAPEKNANTEPPPDSKQQQAAAPTTELVPLPPVRIAEASANEPAAEPPPAKVEYGIDLGGGANVEAVRAHWANVKANYGPLLAGLRPLAATRPRTPSGVDYRLLAGPLPTLTDASRLCARFTAARIACRATRFIGEQLAQH